MELAYVIDEQATIKGVDIELAYNKCLSWLHKIGVKKIKTTAHSKISATHKISGRGSLLFIEKNIDIMLSKKWDDTTIRIIVGLNKEKYRFIIIDHVDLVSWWVDFVLGLWKFLDVTIDVEMIKKFYPKSNLEKRIKAYRFSFRILVGFFVLYSLILISIAGVLNYVIVTLVVIGFGVFISKLCWNRRVVLQMQPNPWRLMSELYPDEYRDDRLIELFWTVTRALR